MSFTGKATYSAGVDLPELIEDVVVKGEISSLERTNERLEQRVRLAQEKKAALTPALAAHWLVYIWRDWRTRPAVGRPS